MAQAVSRQRVTAEARIRARISPCGICVGQSGTGVAVPWLRSLVASRLPRRPGFAPGSIHVGFLVDKVALGQVFLLVLRFSPVSISFQCCCPNSYHLGNAYYANIKAGIHAWVRPTPP
jgi:hypothetical protein